MLPIRCRIPKATIFNKEDFCLKWMWNYGGTYKNAIDVYEIELMENKKRDLNIPYV